MTSPQGLFVLFTLIILEGYVVLSSELLAIRLSLPFVGSGTDTVSVIIAAVLMPLAFGYHTGGRFKPGLRKSIFGETIYVSVRDKLIWNMLVALAFLLFGLSYGFLESFFNTLIKAGLSNRVALTVLYAGIFIAPPVYLLGQTIPLTCNFFSRERLAKITGRILFLSTLGSFLGAVFSTLVLMAYIGVNNTAILNFVILGVLIMMISKEKFSTRTALVWALVIAGGLSNSDRAMQNHYIVESNQYNTIAVIEAKGQRHLFLNGNASSMYTNEGRKHDYIEFIESQALTPLKNSEGKKDILVLGAGAFTLGAEDDFHNYDFVDIDKSLKNVAEERILKKPLMPNKHFHPVPARAFLTGTEKTYDVIVLDAYSGGLSLPEHLITKDFFLQVRAHLKDNGIMLANMAVSPGFASTLSRNLDNTLRSVFPHMSRHVVTQDYRLWDNDESYITNVIYMYRHTPHDENNAIYTDTLNRAFIDRPLNRHHQQKISED